MKQEIKLAFNTEVGGPSLKIQHVFQLPDKLIAVSKYTSPMILLPSLSSVSAEAVAHTLGSKELPVEHFVIGFRGQHPLSKKNQKVFTPINSLNDIADLIQNANSLALEQGNQWGLFAKNYIAPVETATPSKRYS